MESYNHQNLNHSAYYIEAVQYVTIGKEWSNNLWDSKLNPIGCHALYYRTDRNSSTATLYMTDSSIELKQGRIYFIPAFSVLRSEADGEIEKYFIHFQSDVFGMYNHLYRPCSIKADHLSKPLFDIIVNNFNKNKASSKRKINGAMELLLSDLWESISVLPQNTKKFEAALNYIHENYNKKITVAELAKMMNFNEVYFSNLFKSTLNITPKQYIITKRLYESRRLLAHSNLSISEIAEQTGFENANYFSEIFCQKTGISALTFRKTIRGKG